MKCEKFHSPVNNSLPTGNLGVMEFDLHCRNITISGKHVFVVYQITFSELHVMSKVINLSNISISALFSDDFFLLILNVEKF